MVLEKILESPLNNKESKPVNPKGNKSWIFIGRTDAEVEAPTFGYLMQRTDSLEKTLMLGKIEGRRRRMPQWMRWLDGIIDSMDMCLSKLQELVVDSKTWHSAAHEVTKSWTWMRDWTELIKPQLTKKDSKREKRKMQTIKNSQSNEQSSDSKSLLINNYSKYKLLIFFNQNKTSAWMD